MLFDFLISETEIIETKVYAWVDGPKPFIGKISLKYLSMKKLKEFYFYVFIKSIFDIYPARWIRIFRVSAMIKLAAYKASGWAEN